MAQHETETSINDWRRLYKDRYQSSLYEWLVYHQKEIVFRQCEYFGVRTLKNPLDAWIYQEIVFEQRPDVIVEIGSAHGGSTLFFSHLLDLVGNGSVVSVDIDRSEFEIAHDRIVQVTGDSSSAEVIDRVRQLCNKGTVMIVHDGDHRYESVLKELREYSPFVTPGSYFIVEDGIVDLFTPQEMGFEGKGPLYAIREFIQENRDFVIDRSRERYLLTYNPCGYLKRAR